MSRDGGYLIPDSTLEDFADFASQPSAFASLFPRPTPEPLTRRRRFRFALRTWQWRIADAWAHLRGRRCSDAEGEWR